MTDKTTGEKSFPKRCHHPKKLPVIDIFTYTLLKLKVFEGAGNFFQKVSCIDKQSVIPDVFDDSLDGIFKVGVGLHLLVHFFEGVNDGSVVTVGEFGADLSIES